ncbi:hypothetical protein IJJ27_03000 [bacterium]|nr:hypothetical protein [bacterium]
MRKRTFWLLYLMIIFLAVVIRFWQLGKIPFGTYWDEIAILADAKKVALTGTDLHGQSPWHLIYPSYGDYKLAPYIWFATLSVRLFGATPFALRLPSALAGIGTVIIAGYLAYFLALHLATPIKKKKALAQSWQLSTMFITAVTPWSILFSRTAFEGHLGQMFLGLAALLLILSWHLHGRQQGLNIRSGKFWQSIALLFASGFIGGLAFWTYFSVRFVWPVVFILISLFFLLEEKPRLTQFFFSASIIGSIFLVMFVLMTRDPLYAVSNQLRLSTPSLLNDEQLPHQVNQMRLLAGNNYFARLLFSQKLVQLSRLLTQVSQHLDFSYLFLTGDANLRHSTGFNGLFLLCCAPFLLIGLIGLFRRDWRAFCLFCGWWLIGLVPASVPTLSVPHALRSLNSLLPAILIIGFGFSLWMQYIFNAKNKYFYHISYIKYLLTITLLLFALSLGRFCWYYFNIYPTLSANDWQAAATTHVALINKYRQQYDHVYVTDLDRLLFLWYLCDNNFDIHRLDTEYQAENYRFEQLDNIDFIAHAAGTSDGQHNLIIGTADEALKFVQDANLQNPQILEDFTLYDKHYLVVGADS